MKSGTATNRLDQLRATHTTLERELNALNRRTYLTPAEQQRTRVIKKEKLKTKDTIRLMMDRMTLG